MAQNFHIEPLKVISEGDFINLFEIQRLDDARFPHIAKQRDLALFLGRDRPFAATQQNIGLNSNRAQFLDRMLGRFRLHLARALDEGQQGQMDIDRLAGLELIAQLADRFEKGQALDVADRAADLAQAEIDILIVRTNEGLDGIGDMGDDLDGLAQKLPPPFAGYDVLIDPAGGDIVAAPGGASGKAFVMAQIEIGFGPVIGHEHFAMLIGAHRAGIDIEIGIELAQPHPIAPRLKQSPERG